MHENVVECSFNSQHNGKFKAMLAKSELLKHLKKAHESAALSEQRYNEAEQAIIGDGSASREGKAAFTLTCHSDEIAIPPGGMLAVVGAVGAGKTSL